VSAQVSPRASPEFEIRNWKLEIGNQKSEIRNQKLEIGNPRASLEFEYTWWQLRQPLVIAKATYLNECNYS